MDPGHEERAVEERIMEMRTALRNTLIVLSLGIGAPVALHAQTYPVRAIRLVVPFPPGGGGDLIARSMGHSLADALGQQIVVDNRAGAGGVIGLETVAKAAPDGYTLLLSPSGPLVIHPSLYASLSYDPLRDFAPISLLASSPLILVVHPALPANSVKTLVQLAKRQPEKINFASNGKGGSSHLAAELFMLTTQTRMVHVPYKGIGPALTDLARGEVQLMFAGNAILPHVRSGRLRALAVTTARRARVLPDTPTVSEAGVRGYESATWYGLLAPAGTPRAITDRLNADTVKVLRLPEIRNRLETEGAEVIGNSAESFAEYMRRETARWRKTVTSAHISME